MTALNHAGICMSYASTWNYLRLLTSQAKYTELVKSGHWIWVYDNLNIHQRVRHERAGDFHCIIPCMHCILYIHCMVKCFIYGISPNMHADHHSTMLNLTARIAVQLQNFPNWDVDWTDSRPQKPRSSLTCSDFLPDESDAAELHKRAILYVMEVLVTEFKSLSDLKDFVPRRQSPHPVQKSVVYSSHENSV